MSTVNIVPRADNEGSVGTERKKWTGVNAYEVNTDTVNAQMIQATNIKKNGKDLVTAEEVVGANPIRQAEKLYSAGDVVMTAALPNMAYLQCITAGTTARTVLMLESAAPGEVIVDGTCTWVIRAHDHPIVGSIIDWENEGEPGAGFLKCNGAEYNSEDYPLLAAIRDTANAGTFAVPDRRGVVSRGVDEGRGLDVDGVSRAVGSYQSDQLQSHRHVTYIMRCEGQNGDYGRMPKASGYDNYNQPWSSTLVGGVETRCKNVATKYYICYA